MSEILEEKLQEMAMELAERLANGIQGVISKSFAASGISETIEKLTKAVGTPRKTPKKEDPASSKELDNNTCSEPGCNLPARARGLCSKHYQRLRYAEKRAAELGEPPPKTLSEAKAKRLNKPARKTSKRGGGTCSKQGCDNPNYAKGLCGKHFMEWVRSKKKEDES